MDYKYNVISEHPLRHRCDLRIVCAQDVGFSQLLELVAGERKAYFRAQKKSHNRIANDHTQRQKSDNGNIQEGLPPVVKWITEWIRDGVAVMDDPDEMMHVCQLFQFVQ